MSFRSKVVRVSLTALSRLRVRWGPEDAAILYKREAYLSHGETIAEVTRDQLAKSPIKMRVFGHGRYEQGSLEEHLDTIKENLRRS